jgi:hypothetical protein
MPRNLQELFLSSTVSKNSSAGVGDGAEVVADVVFGEKVGAAVDAGVGEKRILQRNQNRMQCTKLAADT